MGERPGLRIGLTTAVDDGADVGFVLGGDSTCALARGGTLVTDVNRGRDAGLTWSGAVPKLGNETIGLGRGGVGAPVTGWRACRFHGVRKSSKLSPKSSSTLTLYFCV